jgi:hypothetical protein
MCESESPALPHRADGYYQENNTHCSVYRKIKSLAYLDFISYFIYDIFNHLVISWGYIASNGAMMGE